MNDRNKNFQPGNTKRKNEILKNLREQLISIYKQEKNPQILIAGDFNVNVDQEIRENNEERKGRFDFITQLNLVIQDFGTNTCKKAKT